jgi:hypothetical protein
LFHLAVDPIMKLNILFLLAFLLGDVAGAFLKGAKEEEEYPKGTSRLASWSSCFAFFGFDIFAVNHLTL